MKFSFTIRDTKAMEALTLFCNAYGYKASVFQGGEIVPNPETRTEFAERILKEIFVGPFKKEAADRAAQLAVQTADGEV